jgi:hypothetical protein
MRIDREERENVGRLEWLEWLEGWMDGSTGSNKERVDDVTNYNLNQTIK